VRRVFKEYPIKMEMNRLKRSCLAAGLIVSSSLFGGYTPEARAEDLSNPVYEDSRDMQRLTYQNLDGAIISMPNAQEVTIYVPKGQEKGISVSGVKREEPSRSGVLTFLAGGAGVVAWLIYLISRDKDCPKEIYLRDEPLEPWMEGG